MNEELFFNRELSWLSFNHRVLQEAKDRSTPLYERIKFLAIFSSNLDEFYRVRVASLRSLLDLKKKKQKKLKFDPAELLQTIQKTVHKHQVEFGNIFREEIIPQLKENKIHLVKDDEFPPEFDNFIGEYFHLNIYPHIQPIMVKQNSISVFLKNRAIYLVVRFRKASSENENGIKKNKQLALIEIPVEKCGRFISLPELNGGRYVAFIDDIIRYSLKQVLPGYEIIETYSIKLTRDAELYIDDEFSGNLLEKIKKSLSNRTTGVPCRLLYDQKMPEDILKYLRKLICLSKDDLFPGGRYHNFHDLFSFPNSAGNELEYEPMPPLNCKELVNDNTVFDTVKKKDILLHYPYQSYDYVINFLKQAAADPSVEEIKITLYRASANSKIIKALIDASKNGKQVTAFVEIKARFDEELNFIHADAMEKAGIKVLYSFPGLKVHSKICLIKRTEKNVEQYYAYLSTGNFNEKTAKVYSDFGFFTSNHLLTNELKKIFQFLSRQSVKEEFEHLLAAPFNLRESFTRLVDNEIKSAQDGKKTFIILKLNSLEDKKMIRKLYEASNAGVKVTIVVRGICCLVPGVKGQSSNIKVISIVDRFLEHSRIYIFCNGGNEKIFIASADWMSRNLDRRVELCFPVYDKKIKKEIKKLVVIQLRDNVKARVINKAQSNPYRKSKSQKKIRSQYSTYNYFKSRLEQNELPVEIKEVIGLIQE